jgi:hypothetical protein
MLFDDDQEGNPCRSTSDSGALTTESRDCSPRECLARSVSRTSLRLIPPCSDPSLLIGRQVPTSHGKYVDLLALDGDGAIHVLELKRDRTPRDVVAQTLDYGSWVQNLSHEDVLGIYAKYAPDKALEVAFEGVFDVPVPEELNTGHFLTVVAGDLDPESERIVNYLAGVYGVPINAVFFRYFSDGDREYVARTWLRDQQQEAGHRTDKKEQWNGKDWYFNFGESPERAWEDARNHGFVSAGGGHWYSDSLPSIRDGARIWVYIPTFGYVGVGTVTGAPQRFTESQFAQIPDLNGTYVYATGEDEWVLPVEWIKTVPKTQAVRHKGMVAYRNTAVRLRNSFTLEILHRAFTGVED